MLTHYSSTGAEFNPGRPLRSFRILIECSDFDTLVKTIEQYPSMLDVINTPDPDARNRTPLNQSIQMYLNCVGDHKKNRHLGIINFLLLNNADPNVTTPSGKNIYSYAVDFPDLAAVLEKNKMSSPGQPSTPVRPNTI
ncbi:MAG: hypothetical protein HON32_09615 [Francisellaceae bacterium]|jgi:hypothetical protein|nr:hypothetical protein [Francisellaceae bacterium]MBT6538526.1 hypothetical protein [Francisellaceae bacterium]